MDLVSLDNPAEIIESLPGDGEGAVDMERAVGERERLTNEDIADEIDRERHARNVDDGIRRSD